MTRDLVLAAVTFITASLLSVHAYSQLRVSEHRAWSFPLAVPTEQPLYVTLERASTCFGYGTLQIDRKDNLQVTGDLSLRLRHGATSLLFSVNAAAFCNPLHQIVTSEVRVAVADIEAHLRTENVSPISASFSLVSPVKNLSRTMSFPGPITLRLLGDELQLAGPQILTTGSGPWEALSQQMVSELGLSLVAASRARMEECRGDYEAFDIAPFVQRALKFADVLPLFPPEALP